MSEPRVSTVMRFPTLVVAGLLKARRGEPGAESMLDQACEFANASGEIQRIAPAATARAEAAWLAGDVEKARAVAAAAYEVVRTRASLWLWYAGALAFWRWRAGGGGPRPRSAPRPGE